MRNEINYEWTLSNLTYDPNVDYWNEYNMTIPIGDKILVDNRTLYLHMEIEADYPYSLQDEWCQWKDVNDWKRMYYEDRGEFTSGAYFKGHCNRIVMHWSIPVVKHYPKVSKKMKNLLSSSEEAVEEEVPILDEFGNKIYEPYLKTNLYVYVTSDFTFYSRTQIP